MKIELADYSMIILIGASDSGKEEFARRHFFDYEINDTDAGNFTRTLQVMCGDWLEAEKRREILKQAKIKHYMRLAIAFMPDENEQQSDADLRLQHHTMQNIEKRLNEEGYDRIYYLHKEDLPEVQVERIKLEFDKKDESGPFDIIGDVHGCYDELVRLIRKLGYRQNEDGICHHPENRKLVFVGDVVDRGDNSLDTLRLIMKLCHDRTAYMVLGNHDDRLRRFLKGNAIEIKHGLETTAAEMERVSKEEKESIISFLEELPTYYLFDEGNLACVHAGIKEKYLGKYSKSIRQFCLYGLTTGEINEIGQPVRLDWAEDYKGDTIIVYGHTPYLYVYKRNNAYCVDTGCVFYNRLSALRYPEMTVVDVRRKKKKTKEGTADEHADK